MGDQRDVAERQPATYDTNKDAQTNATDDFNSIKETFDREGSQAAYTKMQEELATVPPEQQRAYKEALAKALTDGNLLPQMAVAFLDQNQGKLADDSGTISNTRIQDRHERAEEKKMYETATGKDLGYDPIEAAFLGHLAGNYDKIRQDLQQKGDYRPGVQDRDLDVALEAEAKSARENAALRDKAETDKKNFASELVNNPALFNMLDGMNDGNKTDGNISQGDVNKFLERWEKDPSFRTLFGKTEEEQNRVHDAVTNLRDAFDADGNQDDKKGSVVNDRTWPSDNVVSMESLAKGLGYGEGEEAVAKMKEDLKPKEEAEPEPEEEPVTDADAETQARLDKLKANPELAKELAGEDKIITAEEVAAKRAALTDENRDALTPILDAADEEIKKNGPIGLDKLGITDTPADDPDENAEAMKAHQKMFLDKLADLPPDSEMAKAIAENGGKLPSSYVKQLAEAAQAGVEQAENDADRAARQQAADYLKGLADSGQDVDLNQIAKDNGATDFADYQAKRREANEQNERVAQERKQLFTDATQKSGEGPYQAAARILGEGATEADRKALTQILQKQFMSETGAGTWKDAIRHIKVGQPWINESNYDAIMALVAASGNQALIDRFNKTKA